MKGTQKFKVMEAIRFTSKASNLGGHLDDTIFVFFCVFCLFGFCVLVLECFVFLLRQESDFCYSRKMLSAMFFFVATCADQFPSWRPAMAECVWRRRMEVSVAFGGFLGNAML